MARLIIVDDNHELASLIAAAVRTRGHSALSAHTGQAAQEAIELQGFDAAVVDLLLPDMAGSQVLARLKARSIPAIAISGVFKGQRFAAEATEIHGAAAFFEKPFDMKSLLDTIDRLVGVPTIPLTREDLDGLEELTPIEEDQLEELTPIEDEGDAAFILPPVKPTGLTPPPPPPDAHEYTPLPRPPEATTAGTLDEQLTPIWKVPEELMKPAAEPGPTTAAEEEGPGATPVPALPLEEPTPAPASPPAIEDHALRLPFGEREKVWSGSGTTGLKAAEPPQGEQAGDLKTSSVSRLLTAYYQARHTGELKLRQGNVVKVVYFEKGQPIYAASNLAGERFGRFCARKGILGAEKLEEVAALARAQNLRTADAMMRLGLITAPLRRKLLEEQVREIIWSTFGWSQGEYSFVPRKPAGAGLVKLSVFPGELIMEGVKRTETLLSLRQKVPAGRRYVPSADPPYELHQITLSDGQAPLIAHADGTKTVEDLLTLTDLPEKDALATLSGLELLGLLVERRDDGRSRRISFGL